VSASTPSRPQPAPNVVGAGFLALDYLLIGETRRRPNQRSAGGSFGNVLSILSFLGWDSYPVARLGKGLPSKLVIQDLQSCGVKTGFISCSASGVTPIIVIRNFLSKDGQPRSRFEWKHPVSGAWLPRYRPYPLRDAIAVCPGLPNAAVFYFDRAEKSILTLATRYREQGATIFFEPSSAKYDEIFLRCLNVAHIVKYSGERIPDLKLCESQVSPIVEIQTLGQEGLKYRLRQGGPQPTTWFYLPSFAVEGFVDATGCGDWCSAGIINALCSMNRGCHNLFTEAELKKAMSFGQALAALKCAYSGARGLMYNNTKKRVVCQAMSLMNTVS
jgi:fructokinase